MTATEKWKALLVSSQRGPLVTRTAATREQAIAIARRSLDDVAPDLAWLHGDKITVEIEAVGQVFGKYGSKIRLGLSVMAYLVRHKKPRSSWGEGRSGPIPVAMPRIERQRHRRSRFKRRARRR